MTGVHLSTQTFEVKRGSEEAAFFRMHYEKADWFEVVPDRVAPERHPVRVIAIAEDLERGLVQVELQVWENMPAGTSL